MTFRTVTFWDGPQSICRGCLSQGPSPSKTDHILPIDCASLSVTLFSLYYVSLLNSFLHETKGPHLAADHGKSPEIWDITILSHPRAELSCLPPCIFHKHPILKNLLLNLSKKIFTCYINYFLAIRKCSEIMPYLVKLFQCLMREWMPKK